MFDDNAGKKLKQTIEKRYSSGPSMLMSLQTVVTREWDLIFKNSGNKTQLKKLFLNRVQENLRHQFLSTQSLYINGALDDGKV